MEVERKLYIGVVEENVDPRRQGRIKVRVQTLYHQIPVEDIPWAAPFATLAGKAYEVPAIGKLVNVMFYQNDLYDPYYLFSENYNINLQNKLKNLSDDEYVNFVALLFDERTQIYSDNQALTLDYLYNKMTIDKLSINLELKDNMAEVNLGDKFANQQAVLGTHFFQWMDKFIETLSDPFSLIGNMMAPVAKPKINALCAEYFAKRKQFVSNHVKIVDNFDVNKLQRDPKTDNRKNDVDLILSDNDKEQAALNAKIQSQNDAACEELKSSKPTDELPMESPDVSENGEFGSVLPLMGVRISSRYGKRVHPVTKKIKAHQGIDIAAKQGTPFISPYPGTVTIARPDSTGAGGNMIEIDHHNGYSTQYFHLSKYHVKAGDKVKTSQIIGEVGNTGAHTTGPHLHFNVQITKTRERINPENFFTWPSRPNDVGQIDQDSSSGNTYQGQSYAAKTTPCDNNDDTPLIGIPGSLDSEAVTNGLPDETRNALEASMSAHGITNIYSRKAILGVVSKESSTGVAEISYAGTSNYRIKEVFPSKFGNMSDADIDKIKKDDNKFWNVVYGGKFGNDNKNDGSKYRGRGFNGITFKDNYKSLQKRYEKMPRLGKIDIVSNPDTLSKSEIAAEFCILFFMQGFEIKGKDINDHKNLESAVTNFIWCNAGWGKNSLQNKIVVEGYRKAFAFAKKDLSESNLT